MPNLSKILRPPVAAVIGLSALLVFAALGLFLKPLPPLTIDGENFTHWASANFARASSSIDFDVISPVWLM
jgi:hypothetical protein